PQEFTRLFIDCTILCTTAQVLGSHADPLLTFLINNPTEWQHLIYDNDDLYLLIKTFSKHTADIVGQILANPEELTYLFKDINDFCKTASILQQQSNTYETFSSQLQRGGKIIIQRKGSKNIKPVQPAENLLHYLLKSPQEYKRLVGCTESQEKLCALFPKEQSQILDMEL
ncbi:MAG: hypothetical protein ACHP9Y_05755, partial [Gammaproteobacteria bacterium]